MMWRTILLSVVLAVPGFGQGWCRAAEAPFQENRPRKARLLEWNHQTLVHKYEAIGDRDPEWDQRAECALRLTAEHWTRAPDRRGDEAYRACDIGRRVLDAGCRDPMIQYIVARLGEETGRLRFYDARALYLEAAKGMEDSGYDAFRRCMAYLLAADHLLRLKKATDEDRRTARDFLDQVIEELPELAEDRAMPYKHWISLGTLLRSGFRWLKEDAGSVFDRIHEAVSASNAAPSVVHMLEGAFYIDDAWKAGRVGPASKESTTGVELMVNRLKKAAEALDQALFADPGNAVAARLWINVMLRFGNPRDDMERRFRLAVEKDPDMYRTYSAKLRWLEPKWHGSLEDMIAFGRECLKTGNWQAEIPLVLIDAHMAASRYEDGKDTGKPRHDYFRDGAVWNDVEAVFKAHLDRYPGDHKRRTQYARLAAWAGRHALACEQFRLLEGHADMTQFGSPFELFAMRRGSEAGFRGIEVYAPR